MMEYNSAVFQSFRLSFSPRLKCLSRSIFADSFEEEGS